MNDNEIKIQDELESVTVEAYGLWDFLKAVQEKIKEGYEVDFETNEGAPTAYGTFYVTHVRKLKTPVKEVVKKTKAKPE